MCFYEGENDEKLVKAKGNILARFNLQLNMCTHLNSKSQIPCNLFFSLVNKSFKLPDFHFRKLSFYL